MGRELVADPEREERRNRILLEYVEALEEGQQPDRGALLAAHPDLEPRPGGLPRRQRRDRKDSPLRSVPAGGSMFTGRLKSQATGRAIALPGSANSAISGSCAKWAEAGWESCTRPSRSRSGGGSRSRSCRSLRPSTRAGSSVSRPKHLRLRTCSTRGSCRCMPSGASEGFIITRCSSLRGRAWPH